MALNIRTIFLCFFVVSPVCSAEVIKVALEPIPPMVTHDGKGLYYKVLKEVEKISDFTFDIIPMPYSRGREELFDKNIMMLGPTSQGLETAEFYQHAQDLEWSIPVRTDIYAMDTEKLNPDVMRRLNTVGVPFGNEGFIAEAYDIPLVNFRVGEMANLLKMLEIGRVDSVLFERANTMTIINQLDIKGIYYRQIDNNRTGLSVQNSPEGSVFKEELDKLLKTIDTDTIFQDYIKFTNLPESGVVSKNSDAL